MIPEVSGSVLCVSGIQQRTRDLIGLARAGEPGSLQAIREIADRLDGKPKLETEVSLSTAIACDLTDDDLTFAHDQNDQTRGHGWNHLRKEDWG